MRILVCGSRDWADRARIASELAILRPTHVIHGACPTGADVIAHRIVCTSDTIATLVYHVDHTIDGPWPAAGPKRNARMLRDAKPDRGLAFGPLWVYRFKQGRNDWFRSGTGDMTLRMLSAGLPVRWVSTSLADAIDLTAMPEPPR